MDRLAAMEVFAKVAELGSFTKAANALGMPRSTVTAGLQSLEQRLGVKLLHRTTRRVTLTPDGESYLRDVRRLLEEVEGIEAELSSRITSPRGRVRVDVPAAAGRHVLAPALPDFFDRYPDIMLELGSGDRPVELVEEGIDCVIRGGDVFDDTLVGKQLASFRLLTCAAPSYLERAGVPTFPEELANHRLVPFYSPRSGRTFPLELERDGTTWVGSPRHHVASNDADTWLGLVLAGLGIAQLPATRHVLEHVERGELALVLPSWSAGELPIQVLWTRHRRLPTRVRAFIDWVVDLYAEESAVVEDWVRRLDSAATARSRAT